MKWLFLMMNQVPKTALTFLSDDEINENIRSLNTKQRMIYEV